VGGVPTELARELRKALGLVRAVETGTYRGGGTRALAALFPEVVTVELSSELHAAAAAELQDVGGVIALHGDSSALLPGLVASDVPTLWFLDGHWSGGPTAGEGAECPVLDEVAALSAGSPDDCVLIDDARLFAAPPPPPHDPSQWPGLVDVFDALRAAHPGHHVTMLADLVIAVPRRAKPIVDRFGQAMSTPDPPPGRFAGLMGRVKR
jgi:hypothetical protein